MMAARLRHWNWTIILDNHQVGELRLDEVDLLVAQSALKSLFGDRLKSRTVESWLVDMERAPVKPLPVVWPTGSGRARLNGRRVA